jgi:GTP-binding protein
MLHLVVASYEGEPKITVTINEELRRHNPELMERYIVAVATKVDALEEEERLTGFREYCEDNDYPFFAISAATHEGVDKLLDFVSKKLEELKAIKEETEEQVQSD